MGKKLNSLFLVALTALVGTAASAETVPENETAASDSGFYINAGLNDAWYNPATNGQGSFSPYSRTWTRPSLHGLRLTLSAHRKMQPP